MEVKPKRGRPARHPAWKDGVESTQEEAMWPYAECIIIGQRVRTQDIGTLKAMARDKAINCKKIVPVTVYLPGETKYTIGFTPDGKQVVM